MSARSKRGNIFIDLKVLERIWHAKLLAGSGTGADLVTSANDLILQGVDGFGYVRTLLRQNAPLLGKTIRDFNVLSAASGSAGSTRSFNANAEVVAPVSFTDGTTAIVKIAVP